MRSRAITVTQRPRSPPSWLSFSKRRATPSGPSNTSCSPRGALPGCLPIRRRSSSRGRPASVLAGQLDALAEETKSPPLRLQAGHAIWTGLVAEGELVKARARLEEGMGLYNREENAPQAPSV